MIRLMVALGKSIVTKKCCEHLNAMRMGVIKPSATDLSTVVMYTNSQSKHGQRFALYQKDRAVGFAELGAT